MSAIQVWYHDNCYDGFGAAWAAWLRFGDKAAYVPVKYGSPHPDVTGTGQLYILDFSYPSETLKKLHEQVPHIALLDHHKTAEQDLAEFFHSPALPEHLKIVPNGIFVHFDIEESGATLAFEYFRHDPGPRLRFADLLRDRDLWQFKMEGSKQFHAALRSYPFDFQTWSDIAFSQYQIHKLIADGWAILRHQDQMVKIMCDQVTWVTLAGHVVPCVNATCYFSEVGEALCQRFPDAAFSAYYLDRADGKRQWGLRSRNGFDCSTIAKQYGGGGHPGAAGFITGCPERLPA